MRRVVGVVSAIFVTLFVSGCTLPLGVTVASWALDGVSYMATQKSLTDHGISYLAGQDCALHRVVTEMDLYAVCQEYQDPESKETAIADASKSIETLRSKKQPDTFQALTPAQPEEASIEEIANFETAGGGQEPDPGQSDVEKLPAPAEKSGFNIKGIWNFIKNLTSFG